MSIIADFRIKSPDLVLYEAVEAVPEIELEMIQQAGTDPQNPYMFVWAYGGDFDTFEQAMGDDDTVIDIERHSIVDDQILYRMQITDATDAVFYPVWVEVGADLLETRNVDGWWQNRMRFPTREALATVEDWCQDVGVTFDLQRVYTDHPERDGATDLTDAQREVLAVAEEMGYFEVPRQASVDDIADELGVSNQAISERLRRGHKTLVANHVP